MRVTYYPASGLRQRNSGVLDLTGVYAYYWSCAITGINADYLNLNSASVNPISTAGREYSFVVRCVQFLLSLFV